MFSHLWSRQTADSSLAQRPSSHDLQRTDSQHVSTQTDNADDCGTYHSVTTLPTPPKSVNDRQGSLVITREEILKQRVQTHEREQKALFNMFQLTVKKTDEEIESKATVASRSIVSVKNKYTLYQVAAAMSEMQRLLEHHSKYTEDMISTACQEWTTFISEKFNGILEAIAAKADSSAEQTELKLLQLKTELETVSKVLDDQKSLVTSLIKLQSGMQEGVDLVRDELLTKLRKRSAPNSAALWPFPNVRVSQKAVQRIADNNQEDAQVVPKDDERVIVLDDEPVTPQPPQPQRPKQGRPRRRPLEDMCNSVEVPKDPKIQKK
ncbi:uncharacterized protein [Oscarella lobularis]|uniref:uncharacterized protein isoform X1 n=1 Tax=Oscarella lobularis TaxID=121494 RepID=UPI0033137D42